jgi:hypothetical protein
LIITIIATGVLLADSNNKNLGNTPAEIQRNQKLVNSNNQDYAKIDKSKGEDLCSGTNCYGKATQKRLEESLTNKKNTSSNYSNYQVREMQDKNGKVIAYFNIPPVLPSSCNPAAALLIVC